MPAMSSLDQRHDEDKERSSTSLDTHSPAPLAEDEAANSNELAQIPTEKPGPIRNEGLKRPITAQDWTGPTDPENPHNWTFSKRIYHTLIPAAYGFVV